jgi:hypothetical protein
MLTWRGVPGKGLPNCAKTFKMRFLVSAVENPPYDILVGLKSICEDRILFAPTLVHNTITLPEQKRGASSQPQQKGNLMQALGKAASLTLYRKHTTETGAK